MNINKTTLSNGLRVVTCTTDKVQSVTINIIVQFGGRYENKNNTGLAHFLEHMAFKGTKKRSATQIAEEFDSIGGQFNAYTSKEHTVYFAKTLDVYAKRSLSILSDILQNSLFSSYDIKKEASIIKQEIAQTKDNPEDLLYDNLYETTFPNQPLGMSILGSYELISNFTPDLLKKCVKQYYTANNVIISVAGNIDHSYVLNLVNKLFDLELTIKEDLMQDAIYHAGYSIVQKEFEQTNIAISFKCPSYTECKAFYTSQILSLILGGSISSRLFQSIREKLGLAYSCGSFCTGYRDLGLFIIYCATDHNNLINSTKAISLELEKVLQNIAQEELDRSKIQIRSGLIIAEENISYKSEEIGKNIAIFGRHRRLEENLEMINSISIAELLSAAQDIFVQNPSISLTTHTSSKIEHGAILDILNKRI